jgi:hypothetical protein
MLNVPTFGDTADIYAIVHLVPHACHHITVDQSHSSGDTVAKIWRLAASGDTKTVSFINPQKKKTHGVKSGDPGVTTALMRQISCASYPPLWQVSIEIPSHVVCSEPESRLFERCNHYCLHFTVI